MLSALNLKDNSRIYAYERNNDYIRTLSTEKLIICPECRNTLVFKECQTKIPHFAHAANCAKCLFTIAEADSERHVMGKIALKNILMKLYPNSLVNLEFKIEGINNIADVVVVHPCGERWAFEVQCEKLSADKIFAKSKIYQQEGIYDFWLFDYDYSKYIKNSIIRKYGKAAYQLYEKFFRIYFDNEEVEVGNYDKPQMKLSSLIIKRENNRYVFKEIS